MSDVFDPTGQPSESELPEAPAAKPMPRRPERDLSGKQKRQLRGLAHHMVPVVQVGREGIGEGVIGAVGRALVDHELIKVKVLESAPVDRREAGALLSAATGSHVAGALGRIVILYRMHDTTPTIALVK